MSRAVSRLRRLWSLLALVAILVILADIVVRAVGPASLLTSALVFTAIGVFLVSSLLIGVAPRNDRAGPVELDAPVRGSWVAVNTPGQKLPSHGTRTRGQYSAVDICEVSTDRTPALVGSRILGNAAADYPSLGTPILAMAAGTVAIASDGQKDHRARNSWPALAYMMVVEGLVRELLGTNAVLGNHVVIDHGDGTFAAYAHLRRGSVRVKKGDAVQAGDVLGALGNTGNSSMPHLHVHLMDRATPDAAAGITMTWRGLERPGTLDRQFEKYAKPPAGNALEAMPRNGEIFHVGVTEGRGDLPNPPTTG